MVHMVARIRPVLFVLVLAAAAVAASIRLFGGDDAAVTDAPALAGRWDVVASGGTAEAEERFRLRLGTAGRYALAVRSTAGELVTTECGRWQSLEGRWQMRATAGGAIDDATPLLLEHPALRLGHVERPPSPEEPDEAVVVVRAARRGAGTERWTMRRAPGPAAPRADDGAGGRDARDCGPIELP